MFPKEVTSAWKKAAAEYESSRPDKIAEVEKGEPEEVQSEKVQADSEPDYGLFMAELQRRIKRNWHPPEAQEDKRVTVLFRIARDGRLLSLDVHNSSGFPEADKAALDAVKQSAPFDPLPSGHSDDDLAVQFTFDYNVYKSKTGLPR